MTTTPDTQPTCVETVWLRDLDGTGSMHPCAEGDPGAVEYVPALSAASPAGGGVDAGAVTSIDVTIALREWFGGERYARDYEYLDMQMGPQMKAMLEVVFANRRERLASLSPAPTSGPEYHERKDAELKRIAARLAELSPSEGLFCDGGDYALEFRWTTDGELSTSGSEAGGEVVAWMFTHEDGSRSFVSDPDTKRIWSETMKRDLVPLLATPAPSPAGGVREALELARKVIAGRPERSLADNLALHRINVALASPATAARGGTEMSKAERDGFQSKLHWLRAYRSETGSPLKQAMDAYERNEPFGRSALASPDAKSEDTP